MPARRPAPVGQAAALGKAIAEARRTGRVADGDAFAHAMLRSAVRRLDQAEDVGLSAYASLFRATWDAARDVGLIAARPEVVSDPLEGILTGETDEPDPVTVGD